MGEPAGFLDDGNSSLRPTAGVGGIAYGVAGGILFLNIISFVAFVSDGLFGCTLGYISELCLVARIGGIGAVWDAAA